VSAPTQTGSAAAAVEHLACLFTQGDLAAMAYDVQQLAERPTETTPAWTELADLLTRACTLAEHTEQALGRSLDSLEPPDRSRIEFEYCGRTYGAWRIVGGWAGTDASWCVYGRSGAYTWRQLTARFDGAPAHALQLAPSPAPLSGAKYQEAGR
jgi:hypothetical protein